MQRYFVDNEQFQESGVTLTGESAKHITRVMRMKQGDSVICCDKVGHCAVCELTFLNEREVTAKITEYIKHSNELPIRVAIAQGLPKGDKLDFIVQKGTELGADLFYPFKADRSIVKWDAKKEKKKQERLQKIAREAAEQSHRNRIPKVEIPVTLAQLCEKAADFDVKIAAYEEEAKSGEEQNFAAALRRAKPDSSVLIVIGPEGGMSEKEIDFLQENGFIPCGLGPRILRTETAAMYTLAAISYHFELMR